MTEHEQSFDVGIRSTFDRIATVAGQGLLVIIAGLIETGTGHEPAILQIDVSPSYNNTIALPNFDQTEIDDQREAHFIYTQPLINAGMFIDAVDTKQARERIADIEQQIKESNIANGFVVDDRVLQNQSTSQTIKQEAAFTTWVRNMFGEKREVADDVVDNAVVVGVRLSKKPADDETKVFNVTFKEGDQSIRLEQSKLSPRFEFNSNNWDKPAYMLFRIDHKLKSGTSAIFEGASGNIPFAWMVVFIVLSIFFFAVSIYHNWILPRPTSDHATKNVTAQNIVKEFFLTFKSFFIKKQAFVSILFLLLYRFPEAQL